MNRYFFLRTLLAAFSFSLQPLSAAPEETPPSERPLLRVACVGDSITQGSGAEPGKSYPDQLQKLLGSGWKVGNFGVGGRTLLRKGDCPYEKEKAYQDALASRPDAVVIMLGTNDTKPQNWEHQKEFRKDYLDLVRSFSKLPSKPLVFICKPCPVIGEGNWGINQPNLLQLLPRIETIARETGATVIDMHKALSPHPEMIPDRVHPNTAGAGVMAQTVFAALNQATFPSKPRP